MNYLTGTVQFVKVYLHDVVTFSQTFTEHVDRLRQAVVLVSEHGLKFQVWKCKLAKK